VAEGTIHHEKGSSVGGDILSLMGYWAQCFIGYLQ